MSVNLPGISGLTVVSLFDGMSCGRVALDRAGFDVLAYYSSEIDKHAIKVSSDNWKDVTQVGDVCNLTRDVLPKKVNLLMGGSPCQGFSYNGKKLAFDDPRSKLIFEFKRVKDEVDPDYFLLENVNMAKRHQDVISEMLGVEPIAINSSVLSAATRPRIYWTDIPQTKITPVMTSINDVIEWGDMSFNTPGWYNWWSRNEEKQIDKRRSLILNDIMDHEKAACLVARQVSNWNGNLVRNPMGLLRFISTIEAERLMTLPDGYTKSVSNHQAYKMLGNGWTVDVITKLIKGMLL